MSKISAVLRTFEVQANESALLLVIVTLRDSESLGVTQSGLRFMLSNQTNREPQKYHGTSRKFVQPLNGQFCMGIKEVWVVSFISLDVRSQIYLPVAYSMDI